VAVIAAVAARTARIRIGVLVNVLARRRIGEVAREPVTVDVLPGGRLVAGAGLGSVAAEFTGFGESAGARVRAARLDESLGVLDALWGGEPVTVRGQYLTAAGCGCCRARCSGRGSRSGAAAGGRIGRRSGEPPAGTG
jgi:alkanesulfonate monooxygenase SsuD/methylene tetrahydromethanopterin reductase-like flavin-dependent oxidoreductase (luciferase family)